MTTLDRIDAQLQDLVVMAGDLRTTAERLRIENAYLKRENEQLWATVHELQDRNAKVAE